jgi:UPF0755 protein
MPDPTFDDPFAELFDRLPSPSERGSDSSGPAERTADAGAPVTPEPQSTAAPSTPTATGGVPLSRRAAREAAAGANPASGPVAASASPVAATPSQPVVPPVPPQPAAQPAAAQPTPEQEPIDDPAEAWLLAGAARGGYRYSAKPEPAPTPGYARTGQIPILGTTGPTPTSSPTATALDDLFGGTASSDDIGDVPPPRDPRRRRIGGWIALGVILLLLGGAAAGGWYVWNTYEDQIREVMGWEEPKDYAEGMATGEALLTISAGDIPSTISQSLYEAGVTMTPEAFYEMLIDEGLNPTFFPGVYRLQEQMTSAAALKALQDPANKLENSALLREGLTVEQSIQILSESLGIPLEDFQAAVADPSVYGLTVDPAIAAAGGTPMEGWLFPAMYEFDPGVTAVDVIQRMVDRTIQSLDEAGVPAERRQEILTIASIIEREARYEADMQKVSQVIVNRMKPDNQETFGLLQMDSTAQYGFGELQDGTVSTSEDAQFDDNPWNTYVVAGLPIGPIANPGDVAISAAMNPSGGDWMYFVTVNLDTGETVFTTNLADHNRAVEQWLSWCRDNPDSGC